MNLSPKWWRSAPQTRGFFARCGRWLRLVVHLFKGLLTTWTKFPSLNAEQRRDEIARWSRELLRIAGVEIELKGVLPKAPFVVVANHISWADIFAINAIHPVSFVAKIELSTWPIAGRLLKNVGTLFIDRGKKRDTGRVVQMLAQHIRDGLPLAFFPEGRVSHGVGVHAFNASLLQPVVDAEALVLPIVIRYAPLANFDYVNRNFLQSVWAVLGATGARVTLEFLPMQSADNRRALAKALEIAIRSSLQPAADARAPETHDDHPSAAL